MDWDREVAADTDLGWSRHDGDGPVCAPFTGEQGLSVDLPDDPTPHDFFKSFSEDGMWDSLVQQTNIYAEDSLQNEELLRHSHLHKWVPVTVPEMKLFIAVVISMGLNEKADLDAYWSTDQVLETPFYSKTMTRDHFLLILSNLHVSNNA